MGELSEVLILCVVHGKVMDVVEEVSNVQRSKRCINTSKKIRKSAVVITKPGSLQSPE